MKRLTLKKSGRMLGHPTLRGDSRDKEERSILLTVWSEVSYTSCSSYQWYVM
jgi:hypothetical protein